MSEYDLIQKLVVEMQSSETPVLPVHEANLFSIAKAAYKQARAEVIEEVKEIISKQRFDMTGDSWNIREQLLKALTKLSEVEK